MIEKAKENDGVDAVLELLKMSNIAKRKLEALRKQSDVDIIIEATKSEDPTISSIAQEALPKVESNVKKRAEIEALRSSGGIVGDKSGEHRIIKRGQYNSWVWVAMGFLYNFVIIGCMAIAPIFELFGIHATDPQDAASGWCLFISIALGAAVSVIVYRNRWRCIEAFSSRFVSGFALFSMIYVPIISGIYADYRGIKKSFVDSQYWSFYAVTWV